MNSQQQQQLVSEYIHIIHTNIEYLLISPHYMAYCCCINSFFSLSLYVLLTIANHDFFTSSFAVRFCVLRWMDGYICCYFFLRYVVDSMFLFSLKSKLSSSSSSSKKTLIIDKVIVRLSMLYYVCCLRIHVYNTKIQSDFIHTNIHTAF